MTNLDRALIQLIVSVQVAGLIANTHITFHIITEILHSIVHAWLCVACRDKIEERDDSGEDEQCAAAWHSGLASGCRSTTSPANHPIGVSWSVNFFRLFFVRDFERAQETESDHQKLHNFELSEQKFNEAILLCPSCQHSFHVSSRSHENGKTIILLEEKKVRDISLCCKSLAILVLSFLNIINLQPLS
jgi:hypothetical protein